MSSWRIVGDQRRCIGANQCQRLYPAGFDQDDDGLVDVLIDQIGADEVGCSALLEAVKQCPSGALSVETIDQ